MATGGKGNSPSPHLDVDEKQKQEDEYREQLFQLEKEIQTLKKVLQAKCTEANELKNKLGISPISELKQDIKQGFQAIQDSGAVQMTNAAFRSIGEYATKTVGTIKNSSAMKTIEDKVGTAYNTVKQRLSNPNVTNLVATTDADKVNSPTEKCTGNDDMKSAKSNHDSSNIGNKSTATADNNKSTVGSNKCTADTKSTNKNLNSSSATDALLTSGEGFEILSSNGKDLKKSADGGAGAELSNSDFV